MINIFFITLICFFHQERVVFMQSAHTHTIFNKKNLSFWLIEYQTCVTKIFSLLLFLRRTSTWICRQQKWWWWRRRWEPSKVTVTVAVERRSVCVHRQSIPDRSSVGIIIMNINGFPLLLPLLPLPSTNNTSSCYQIIIVYNFIIHGYLFSILIKVEIVLWFLIISLNLL